MRLVVRLDRVRQLRLGAAVEGDVQLQDHLRLVRLAAQLAVGEGQLRAGPARRQRRLHAGDQPLQRRPAARHVEQRVDGARVGRHIEAVGGAHPPVLLVPAEEQHGERRDHHEAADDPEREAGHLLVAVGGDVGPDARGGLVDVVEGIVAEEVEGAHDLREDERRDEVEHPHQVGRAMAAGERTDQRRPERDGGGEPGRRDRERAPGRGPQRVHHHWQVSDCERDPEGRAAHHG